MSDLNRTGIPDLEREIRELRAENARLQSEKIHYPDGAHHCACVQPLEAEIKRLTSELEEAQNFLADYESGSLGGRIEMFKAKNEQLTAERDRTKVALAGLLDTIDGATSADLHHHQCPKYARFGSAEYICDCGADKAEEVARAELSEHPAEVTK